MSKRLSVELNLKKQRVLIVGGDQNARDFYKEFSQDGSHVELVGSLEDEELKLLHNRNQLTYRGKEFYPAMIRNMSLVITTVSEPKLHHALAKAVEQNAIPFYTLHYSELSTASVNLAVDIESLSIKSKDNTLNEECMQVILQTWNENFDFNFENFIQVCKVTTPIVNSRLKQREHKTIFWQNLLKKGYVKRAITDPFDYEKLIYDEIGAIESAVANSLSVSMAAMTLDNQRSVQAH